MSRTGDCWDNAVAESFLAPLKAEFVDHQHYRTRDEAIASSGDYIERFYNPTRTHLYLGDKSPIDFELRAHVAAIAAQSPCPRGRGRITPFFPTRTTNGPGAVPRSSHEARRAALFICSSPLASWLERARLDGLHSAPYAAARGASP